MTLQDRQRDEEIHEADEAWDRGREQRERNEECKEDSNVTNN
jgi:hypothetical protein